MLQVFWLRNFFGGLRSLWGSTMATKPAVCGIDFGASESYVAYVGKGIVDIVQNEAEPKKKRKKVVRLDAGGVGKIFYKVLLRDMNRYASMAM